MDDEGAFIFFWLIVGAGVGGLIGATRNNVGSGVVWGALLGPIGWIIVFCLDNRPKCKECREPINQGATRCSHCGFDNSARRSEVPPIKSRVRVENKARSTMNTEDKKCPFCAEIIKREAIKCRFCGSDLREQPPAKLSTEPRQNNAPKLVGAEVHFECHACRQPIAADADAVGQQFRCPECGETLEVPSV